jgi:predicted protein tyrosine phosphatase
MYRNVPGWNVKSAGTMLGAVNPVTQELIDWADHLIVMEDKHRDKVLRFDPESDGKIHVLGVEDCYRRNSKRLTDLIEEKMKLVFI